jgi:predicted amidohydrolase YtcJ
MMKSMVAADVPVALGSDGPLNPYLNVMFASINANNPAEALTREQAVSAYTLGAARAEMMEAETYIFTVPPDALPATASVLTLVSGAVVHEAKWVPIP